MENKMAFVKKLFEDRYIVFNVTQEKRPIMPNWSKLGYEDICKTHNLNSDLWGMRMGLHPNGRRTMVIDFDCCGPVMNGARVGCEYTKKKLAEYKALNILDGMFDSSTIGNANVIVDYTDCPKLQEIIGTNSKYKKKGADLEILVGSGHQNVIPPAATKCKISGKVERPRTWVGDTPILVLQQGTDICRFIETLVLEAKTGESNPIAQKEPKRNGIELNSAEEPSRKSDDKYIDLLFNVIGNNNLDWDDYFQVAGILKSNGYCESTFMEWSRLSEKHNEGENKGMWRGIKKETMDIKGLYNLARKINPSGYNQWKGKYERMAGDDTEAAKMIREDLKDVLIADKEGRLWFKKDRIWIGDRPAIEDAIRWYTLNSGISFRSVVGKNKDVVAQKYTQNLNATHRIVQIVMLQAKETGRVDDLYDKFHSTTKGRMCFSDGVLDAAQKKFYNWDEVDFEYYSTVMIPLKFGEYWANPDRDVMKNVQHAVFDTLFHAKKEMAMTYLSRSLFGHTEDKNWGTYLGYRDCGKGVLFDCLKNAFGDYVTDFNLLNIMYERKRNTDEVARKNYWMLPLEWARLAISQEIPADDGLRADAQMIKGIVSGGDSKRARRNFDRVDTVFKISASLFVMGNNELKVDEKDVFQHCYQFSSAFQFKSKEFIDRIIDQNPNDPTAAKLFRIKDDSVKTEKVHSVEWRLAAIMLVAESYRDAPMHIEISDDDEGAETALEIRKDIMEKYEITNCLTDTVVCKTVKLDLAKWSMKMVTSALEAMGVIKKTPKSGGHRNLVCFAGMRIRPPEEPLAEPPEEL